MPLHPNCLTRAQCPPPLSGSGGGGGCVFKLLFVAVIAAEGRSLFSQHLYLAGAKGFSKGLEIGEYTASIVCLCVLEWD